MPLPRLMVAPTGATRTPADHPALPVTLYDVIRCARACREAGADGLHLHLRDEEEGGHLLDSGAYREALEELDRAVPGMAVQITTEAGGRYGPAHQAHVALHSGAGMVSVSVREITSEGEGLAARLYAEAEARGIAVQHILYDLADAVHLARVLPRELFRTGELQLLFVLGRHAPGRNAVPEMLEPFRGWMAREGIMPDWAVCAFGQGETACLRAAAQLGESCGPVSRTRS